MTRNIGITFAMSALMVAFLAAADDAPPAKGDKEPAKKQPADQPPVKDNDAKGKEDPAAPDVKQEDPKEIINRLKDEFDNASTELEKSKDARKTQKDIIDDLDKLIKAQNDKDCNCSGSSSSGKSGSSSGQSQAKSSSSGNSSNGQGSKGQGEQKGSSQANKSGQKGEKGGENEKKEDHAKKEGAKGEEKKDQAKLDDGKKEGKTGGDLTGGGGGEKNSKKTSSVEDLKIDIWGHYPDKKRKELDIYASERFMPKYEEILRQYYRKLAEQNSKKEGD